MIKINSTDIDSIEKFPLLWRCNQITHSVFPDEDLILIHPLVLSKAQELHGFITDLDQVNSLEKLKTFGTSDSEEDVRVWLNNFSHEKEIVFVSWDKETCVKIPFSLFIQRWSDFCYPSSDDVFIYPLSGSWLLEYRHYEEFTFKEIRAHNQGLVCITGT